MLVTGPPRRLAVAPVKIKVPLFPAGSSRSFPLNASIAARENEKAPAMPVCNVSCTSSGVTDKKGLKTPAPALNTAARTAYSGFGNRCWIDAHAEVTSSFE